ncbi:unnamed protein product [Boreogadus saida]
MLSNYTDLAMEQSKQISTLSAAIQNTILWDSTCPRPAASSTPSPLWTEVVVRNRNGLHGRCTSPPRLNLANKYSVLSEVGSQTGAPEAALRPTFQADSSASSRQMTKTEAVTRRSSACVTHTAATATSHLEPRQPMHGPTVSPAKRTPAAVDAPAATTSRRSPPPPSLPAAQVGDRPVSRRLQLSGPSAPPVCIGAAAGGVLSPTGDSADWPVVTRADCRSQRKSISARRQLLRNAVRRRPGSLPAPAICLQNPGSTSPVEPSAAAPVAAHRPTIPCASGLAGRKGVVQQQHRGPRPASPQLTPSPPSTIILEIEGEIEVDFKSVEKDITGDRESNQEATLPGAGDSGAGDPVAGDPGICVPRASQSGVNSEGITFARASCSRDQTARD